MEENLLTGEQPRNAAESADHDAWVDRTPPDELLDIVCPPIRPRGAIARTEPAGALNLWREELRRGVRVRTTFDALWRAACHEAAGVEWKASQLPLLASLEFEHGERIIRDASRKNGFAAHDVCELLNARARVTIGRPIVDVTAVTPFARVPVTSAAKSPFAHLRAAATGPGPRLDGDVMSGHDAL